MKLLCVHPGASYATGDVFDGYARALVAQGHDVQHYDLCTRLDDAVMFYRWRQRWRRGTPDTWEQALLKASREVVAFALMNRPDWVLIFSAMYFHPDMLLLLRRAGTRVAMVFSESPYDDGQQARLLAARDPSSGARLVDAAFTNERTSVATLGRVHPAVHYLPHAFDPERSAPGPIPDDTPRHDVLFIGTLFEERIALLGAVDWDGIDFAIYGSTRLLPSRHRLRRYVRGDIVDNRTAQAMYRAAKINLNPYRTSQGYGLGVGHIERAESLNPRALELAACGAVQLSDIRAEVREVFRGVVDTYTTADELEGLVRSYRSISPSYLEYIGNASREYVQGHTYAHRARQLTATLAAHGASREAQAAD